MVPGVEGGFDLMPLSIFILDIYWPFTSGMEEEEKNSVLIFYAILGAYEGETSFFLLFSFWIIPPQISTYARWIPLMCTTIITYCLLVLLVSSRYI